MRELLHVIWAHYAEPLEPWEERQLMLCDSKHAARLRRARAAGQETPRGALLGSRRSLEFLRRCAGGATAYECILHA